MKKPQSIRSILDQTLKSLEIDVPLKTYSIWGAWNKIVGESVAEHSQPRSIRNHILFIDVSHSTWMQQLQFLKPTLLEKINIYLGEPLIQDIRFRLGKISPPSSTSSKEPPSENKKLNRSTLNQIDRIIQGIEDESVKKGLREVLIKSAKLEKSRKKI
ncbi:MAG: DUF721 domain-containing protein [Syntrophaceae bacterium]|nr:DUF721 domain-containing protein [Syntrophaceae bacterium]